jgi:HlyD family secretion protein
MKKKIKGITWLAWSASLVLLSTISWLVYAGTLHRSSEPVEVRLIPVKKDTVEDKINQSGTVELGNQQTLKSPADGTVEQVSVSLGEKVKSGQTLVVLQDPQRQTALANQQLEIQKQELKLDRSRQKVLEASEELRVAQTELQKLGAEELEIDKLKLLLVRNREKVVEFKEKLQAAQRELQQLEVLLEKGFIPENELEQQKDQVLQVQSQLRDGELAVSTNELELQRLEMELQSKQQEFSDNVLRARSQLRDNEVAFNTDLRELERLGLERKKIEQEIQKNIARATTEAMVLDIQAKLGDVVKLGDPLLTLGDPAEELVKIELFPLDAVRLRVNQIARIRPIGANSQSFMGKVQSISRLAVVPSNAGNNKSSTQATVTATVKLDRPNQILIPGSKVDVEIILAARQDVVVLNRELIQFSNSDTFVFNNNQLLTLKLEELIKLSNSEVFVWVQDAQGKAQKRLVTLGLEGLTTVEVTSGLKPGDQVVLPLTEPSLKPGMPLRVTSGGM